MKTKHERSIEEFWNSLREREKELDEIIKYAEKVQKGSPAGALRIAMNKGTTQYYWRENSQNAYGTYIRKSNIKFIQALAQKDYARKLCLQAVPERKQIHDLLSNYRPCSPDEIYEMLPCERKKIVTPYVMPLEKYVSEWQSQVYVRKPVNTNKDNPITTEKKEVVRSKSEKILADKFYIMGIPYHYEKPLYLKDYGEIFPDFTILNQKLRREYLWEHLGMMGNSDYAEKTVRKIETYQRNGYFIGENLILTYETENHPLNMKVVEKLIDKYLL